MDNQRLFKVPVDAQTRPIYRGFFPDNRLTFNK